MKKAVIYARVSTKNQTVENQLQALREAAQRQGWYITTELTDEAISGSKGRRDRPGLDKLFDMIAKRDVDVVLCWALDRLGRSLQDLIALMNDMNAKGVDLYCHTQNIDTTTSGGRLLFSIMGSIAQFEREIIKERINAGLNRARAEGKKLGRPSNVNANTAVAAKLLREKGASIGDIAKNLKIGVGSVYKVLEAA
jgi:DNA invertase Pin-like site-specific DNA recombinase